MGIPITLLIIHDLNYPYYITLLNEVVLESYNVYMAGI